MVEDDVLKKLETIPLFKGVTLEDRQELLKKMHRKAEDKLNTTHDLVYLAESILNYFSDTGWATRVYSKAEKAKDIHAYGYELAKSLADKLGDRKWARRIRQL